MNEIEEILLKSTGSAHLYIHTFILSKQIEEDFPLSVNSMDA